MKKIEQTLLDEHGNLPQRSGLNWGQRAEYNREPNQAYIKYSAKNHPFFPEKGVPFTIKTKDDHIFQCVIAQQGDKAIHTPNNNSEFGIYFRKKLGVPLGQAIQLKDLEVYGRTSITFYKESDDVYLMEF